MIGRSKHGIAGVYEVGDDDALPAGGRRWDEAGQESTVVPGGCRHCGGALVEGSDQLGAYTYCLNCGREPEINPSPCYGEVG